ncbi:hypothetical protein [Lactobacillus johnsonii]|uniref:hypothetical protein n=1 Tax=Lactobacillus johnsonii TaxID=33959 RepID=UPI0028E7D11C|nr:hypothetical protein [Lactobacillus johnsonii]MDT9605895.1 hypothetical protein [Lactobacillus johnsonii]
MKKINTNTCVQVMYIIILALNIFSRSMFSLGNYIGVVEKISFVLSIIMLLMTVVYSTFSIKFIILMLLGIIVSILSQSIECATMLLILFSLTNVSLNKTIKYSVVAIVICLMIIIISNKLGIIPTIIGIRYNKIRYSFGMQFPLVLSAYILYLSSLITILFHKRHPYFLIMGLIITTIILDVFVNARNDELCILGLALVVLVNKVSKSIIKYVNIGALYLVAGLVLLSMNITNMVSYTSNLYYYFNYLFSGRLNLQYMLFADYHPKLIGQYIPQRGLGGLVFQNVANYFYIDNSYLRFLFMDGIIFFGFIIYIFFSQVILLEKNDLYVYSLILLIILVNGITSDTLSTITQNIIILPLFFRKIEDYKNIDLSLNKKGITYESY